MNAPFASVELDTGYADASALLKILADPVAPSTAISRASLIPFTTD